MRSSRLVRFSLSGIPLVLLVYAVPALCGFIGPTTVVRGTWGAAKNEYGFHSNDGWKVFPTEFCVNDQMELVIADELNKRITVFGSDGNLLSQFQAKEQEDGYPGYTWPGRVACGIDRSVYTYNWDYRLQKYALDGAILWTVDVDIPRPAKPGLPGPTVSLTPGLDDSVWLDAAAFTESGSTDFYLFHYSASGELIKEYKSWPVELGVVQEERLSKTDRKIQVRVQEKTWTWSGPGAWCGRPHLDAGCHLSCAGDRTVYRYDDAAGAIVEFHLPSRMFEDEVRKHEKILQYDYLGPYFAANGDVYAIKEPGSEFEIARWRWEEGPDTPRDLVARTTVGMADLTWHPPLAGASDVTTYEVFRATERCGSYSLIGAAGKDRPEFQDKQLQTSPNLFYKVRAVMGDKKSGFSSSVMIHR